MRIYIESDCHEIVELIKQSVNGSHRFEIAGCEFALVSTEIQYCQYVSAGKAPLIKVEGMRIKEADAIK